MRYRIGIDIGGTFTDLVLLASSGEFRIYKEDSSQSDPLGAIARGLIGLAEQVGLSTAELLADTDILVHGQTRATNALIERTGPRVGLLATEGFRDVLYFGNAGKPERFNIHLQKPQDFVPRYLRIGVPERIGRRGEIYRPLDEEAVHAAARYFSEHQVESIAISFLWSFANPAHETRAAEILRSDLPNVEIFCSSDVLPEIGEWHRTSAAVLSAYVSPMISEYLRAFESTMKAERLPHAPLIMQVNGGCAPVNNLLAHPVNAIASGPAAAPAAGQFYASVTKYPENLIIVDMGGTSFDVCMLRDGEPIMSRSIKVADQPIGVNGVEVLSIGAGGGSVAWVDTGGALRVGPRSAGSEPGPACYGRGGREPTVTDANLVAGRMSTGAFLGGRRALDLDAARSAIKEYVADPLGMSVDEAAAGILTIVNSNMVSAIESISIKRGVDPREYAMVAGGGAGGLHASDCARVLGIQQVVIPALAGGLCAFGMSVTPVRHDYVRVYHCLTNDAGAIDGLSAVFDELIEEGSRDLASDGFLPDDMKFARYLEGKYAGQVHNITIPLPDGEINQELMSQLENTFHNEHEARFTYSMREQPIEALHWRVVATAGKSIRADISPPRAERLTPPGREEREVYFPATEERALATVFDWDELPPGTSVLGPSIIESSTTTTVIYPGDSALACDDGTLLLSIETAEFDRDQESSATGSVTV